MACPRKVALRPEMDGCMLQWARTAGVVDSNRIILQAKGQRAMIAITGGRIVTASGPDIAEGVVLIDAGKIVAVGRNEPVPEGVQVIEAQGKIITPGLIDAHTHLGLDEQGIGAAGDDTNESVDP